MAFSTEQLQAALRKAHAAGDVQAAQKLVAALQKHAAPAREYRKSRSGETPIPGGGLLESALQGVTLGASDEIQAGLGATKDWVTSFGQEPWGEAYDARHKEILEQFDPWADENPVKNFAANVGGGFATAGGLLSMGKHVPKIGQAASKLPAMVRYPAAGAGAGAVAGGMSAAPGQRTQGATGGALVGAGMGGAGLAAYPLASALTNAPRKAVRKLRQAIDRDEMTVPGLARKVDQLGADASISSAGGPNVRGLAEAAAQSPGLSARKALALATKVKGRQAGRVLAPLERALGPGRTARATFDQMAELRSKEAAPLYDMAFAVPIAVTDTLRDLVKRPSVQAAIARVKSLAKEEGAEIPDLDMLTDTPFADVGAGHNSLSMKGWDYIKRSLDDVITKEHKNALTGKIMTEEGRAAFGTLKQLRDELDRLNPTYKAARAIYSGRTQSMEALNDGLKFIRDPAEITAKEIQALAPGDAEFFRLGAARSIREMIEKKGDTHDVTRLFANEHIRGKLRAVFPDRRSYQEFKRATLQEARKFSAAAQTQGNSATFRRGAFADDSATDTVMNMTADAITGNPAQAVRGAVAGATRSKQGMPPELSDELARLMFETPGSKQQEILRMIANPTRGRPVTPGLLSIGGGAAGGQMTPY